MQALLSFIFVVYHSLFDVCLSLMYYFYLLLLPFERFSNSDVASCRVIFFLEGLFQLERLLEIWLWSLNKTEITLSDERLKVMFCVSNTCKLPYITVRFLSFKRHQMFINVKFFKCKGMQIAIKYNYPH